MARNMEIQATGARLLTLRRKLAARDGVPGYEKNCEALRAEIARLERSTIPEPSETTTGGVAVIAGTSSGDTTQSETATEQTGPSSGLENPKA